MARFRARKIIMLVIVLLVLPGLYADGQLFGGRKARKAAEQKKDNDEGQDEGEEENGSRRKKKRHKKQYEGKEASASKPANSSGLAKSKPIGAGKRELYYPQTKLKKRYRVSVILPLFLDELVRGESVTFRENVPEKAAPGLAFYQGLKLAADSLRNAGAMLDIYIHDAGSFRESPEMLINGRKLDSTDLIIGAVEQHDIPALAGYARKKKINFVSVLSNYDGWVKDNQFFTMLQPTVKTHCEFIIDDLSARYAGQNVALLYRTSSLADDNAALYILNDLYSDVTFRKLLCNKLPGRDELASVLDTTKPNVVVVSILDHVFADSILKVLSKCYPGTHFEIYGMPGWNAIPNLRKTNPYKNLTINVSYPFNFETTDSTFIRSVQNKFNREFGGTPSEMVWRGYEAMLWYGTLLQQYGTVFNNDYTDLTGAPFTRFKIKPRWDRNGSLLYLENKQIYMSVYQGGVYKTK